MTRTPMRALPVLLLAATVTTLLAACSGGDASLPAAQRPIPRDLPIAERESHRKLPIEGAHNFRDLGGYETTDGRRVKWGLVYRSDKLAELSDQDLAYLLRLDLQQIVDFRTEFEKQEDPDRIPAGTNYVERPLDVKGTAVKEMYRAISSGDLENLDIEGMLVTANRAFVTDTLEPFREHIHSLANPDNLPSLAHCTGGKDRAGFASAVTLLVLGVPREQILHDFMLTNTYTEDYINRTLWVIRFASLFRTDPEQLRPLLGVEQRYLEAAFDAIDETYGSTENFIREGLGISDQMREQIRANLLEA